MRRVAQRSQKPRERRSPKAEVAGSIPAATTNRKLILSAADRMARWIDEIANHYYGDGAVSDFVVSRAIDARDSYLKRRGGRVA